MLKRYVWAVLVLMLVAMVVGCGPEGTEGNGEEEVDRIAIGGGTMGGAFHIAVPSNIDSIADLKGKHLSVGPEGNPSSEILARVLEEYGFTFDDIRASYLPWDEGIRSLMDGQVDAAIVLGAAPMSAVQEMAATPNFDYKLLSIDEDIVDKIPPSSWPRRRSNHSSMRISLTKY